MTEWIEIFKAGQHTDSAGNTKTWTKEDIDKIAAYNPAEHEAPVVIGHPKDNAPAWGWVEALKSEGGILYAKLKNLIPEFVDMVSKGMFKKRSVSLYPDLKLRHIGFLGAMPPAVKGLADIAFKEEGGTVIEFEDKNNRKEAKHMKFFEWLKGLAAKEGVTLEDMPQALPAGQSSFSEADVQAKINAALKEKEAEFSEKVASLEEARKKKDAELKAREDALKAKEAEGKKQAIASFCEGLLKAGKLVPAMLKHGMGLQNFLEQVSALQTTIEFTEGDEKKSQTPFEFMQSFLSALPKAIEFGEVAGNDKDAGSGDAGEKLARLVRKKMEQNKDLSYNIAFSEVQKENSTLAAEYAEELKGGN